jgi:hypothetical protein
MLAHSHDLGDNGIVGPLDAKDLGQLLEVLGRRLTDREDGVAEPALIKELHTQLRCEKRNVFDDGQSNTPLLVLGKLDNGRKEGLRK